MLEPVVKLTVAEPSPATILVMVGAEGTATGVTETVLEATPSTVPLMAFRAMVYDVPLVNPVMTTGLAASAGDKAVYAPPFKEYL